jgi:nucleotide-binding universal stress UspA family protein
MRLLVVIRGLPYSKPALRLAGRIAQRAGRTLTLLSVIRHEADRAQAETTLNRLHTVMTRACCIENAKALDIDTRIRVGRIVDEVVNEAQEDDYDLIVIGNYQRQYLSLVQRFVPDRIVQGVVDHSPCPVVIAKGEIGPIHKILLCDSGAQRQSLLSRLADRLAALLVEEVDITVLHVMSQISAGPGVRGRQLRADAEELIRQHSPEGEILARDIEIFCHGKLQAHAKIRHGLVLDEIVQEAQSGDYALVVIGTREEEGWTRFLLDDLSHQIISHVNRPILVVR